MAVLVVLFASLALFGGLSVLGVDALSTWRDAAAWSLATMFLFTASAHFIRRGKTSSRWSRKRSRSLGSW